jgi:hypothetical protein
MPLNPFWHPFFLLRIPPPTSWKLSLTYLEIPPLCRCANSRPLWSQVGCILNPPPRSPIPLSPFQQFPLLNTYPLKTTLRYRLHIIRHKYAYLYWIHNPTVFIVPRTQFDTIYCLIKLPVPTDTHSAMEHAGTITGYMYIIFPQACSSVTEQYKSTGTMPMFISISSTVYKSSKYHAYFYFYVYLLLYKYTQSTDTMPMFVSISSTV